MEQATFEPIIVGAGPAGLTVANASLPIRELVAQVEPKLPEAALQAALSLGCREHDAWAANQDSEYHEAGEGGAKSLSVLSTELRKVPARAS